MAQGGGTDTDRLTSLAATARGESMTTSTIGLGHGFDEDLLTAMADAGGGNAHHAASAEDLPRLFARELDRLATLTAQNVSVENSPAPGLSLLEVLHEYPTVPVEGGLQVQLGDCFGADMRSIIFRLRIPGIETLGPREVGKVVLRWTSDDEDIPLHERTIPLVANVASPDEAEATGIDAEVTEQVTLLTAMKAQRRARNLADSGDAEGAADVLMGMVSEMRSGPAGPLRDQIGAQAARLQAHAGELRSRGWHAADAHYLSVPPPSEHGLRRPRPLVSAHSFGRSYMG